MINNSMVRITSFASYKTMVINYSSKIVITRFLSLLIMIIILIESILTLTNWVTEPKTHKIAELLILINIH